MNELLFIIEIIIVFSMLLFITKKFGKCGLIGWVAVISVLANIQVLKNVNLLGMGVTLGNVLFASNFLATDIASELYGESFAKNMVKTGLSFVIIYIVISQLTIAFQPNEFDFINESMLQIFTLSPRICLSSLLMYTISNYADVILYGKLKKKFKGKKLWLRNNISTILCNTLENVGFNFLAFYGVLNNDYILTIIITTSIVEIIVALLDTPFLYIAKKIKN